MEAEEHEANVTSVEFAKLNEVVAEEDIDDIDDCDYIFEPSESIGNKYVFK